MEAHAITWGKLSPEVRDKLLYGTGGKSGQRTDSSGTHWEGILSNIQRRYDETESDSVRIELDQFMIEKPCTTCGGRRLKPESLAVTLAGQNLGDLVQLSITDALSFFESVPVRGNGKPGLDPEIAAPILKEVRERLRFLNDVGLEYLTLGRSAESLSTWNCVSISDSPFFTRALVCAAIGCSLIAIVTGAMIRLSEPTLLRNCPTHPGRRDRGLREVQPHGRGTGRRGWLQQRDTRGAGSYDAVAYSPSSVSIAEVVIAL